MANIIDLIMEIPFFDSLMEDELSIVANQIEFIEIDNGEYLFKEGDLGDYVCFVVDGKLEVVKESDNSESSVVISAVGKNRSIGEMSVIDNTPRSASVRAISKTSLIMLSKTSFDSILKTHPRIGIEILKKIARLMSLNLRKTSARLADYMLPIA